MAIQPNTLAEKHALLDAQADGKTIKRTNLANGVKTSWVGYWDFTQYRYDIVSEPWRGQVIVDKNGNQWVGGGSFNAEDLDALCPSLAPFRLIDAVEVMP